MQLSQESIHSVSVCLCVLMSLCGCCYMSAIGLLSWMVMLLLTPHLCTDTVEGIDSSKYTGK